MQLPADLEQRLRNVRAELGTGQMEVERAAYALKRIPPKYFEVPEVASLAGRLYLLLGNSAAGIELINRAFRGRPGDPEIVCDLAKLYFATNRREEALGVLRDHMAAHPTETKTPALLLFYLNVLNRSDEARKVSAHVSSIEGDSARSRLVKAHSLQAERRYPESIAMYRGALELSPTSWTIALAYFLTLLYAGWDPAEIYRETSTFCDKTFGGVPRRNIKARLPRPRLGTAPGSPGVVRVGYVGATFCKHVVSMFMEPLLAAHDKSRVWVAAYSETAPEDTISERMKGYVDLWRPIKGLSDRQVLDMIERDEIDVLVDLGGHTDASCLPLFASKAAPVQATFLGYPATTGLRAIDWKITDALADPPGEVEQYYTEKVWRLPRCAWAFSQFKENEEHESWLKWRTPPSGPLRLGALNLLTKVDPATAKLWGRALAAIDPAIQLVLVDRRGMRDDPSAMKLLFDDFAAGGLTEPEKRLVMLPPTDKSYQALARYETVDLNLDPLGYNGTTTTCEAMWYGLPTLTLPGKAHVSRVGYSLMTSVGLPEFVATTEDEFVAKVVAYAKDPSPLRELRPTLRDRLKASPVGDAKSLATAMEDAFHAMVAEKVREEAGG